MPVEITRVGAAGDLLLWHFPQGGMSDPLAIAAQRVDINAQMAALELSIDKDWLRLRGSVPLRIENGDAVAEFELDHEKSATFILEASSEPHAGPHASQRYAADAFKRTTNFWRTWIGRSTYRGRWRDEVNRSALVMRLLVSQEHGSLIAAPTSSSTCVGCSSRSSRCRRTWRRG